MHGDQLEPSQQDNKGKGKKAGEGGGASATSDAAIGGAAAADDAAKQLASLRIAGGGESSDDKSKLTVSHVGKALLVGHALLDCSIIIITCA